MDGLIGEPVPGVFVPAPGAAHQSYRALIRQAHGVGLSRVWRASYLQRDRVADPAARLHALEQSAGIPLLACHATAAALHGFDITEDPRLHVTTTDGRSLRRRPGVVVHQVIPRSGIVQVRGVAAISAVDAAVDLACAVRETDVLAVLDAAMRCDVTPELLRSALEHAARRRGVIQVRSWADYADWRAESPMESRTRQLMLAAGFPAPDLQVEVSIGNGGFRYLDAGWRRYRVGVDYDGDAAHAGAGERDRQRHNDITHVGWRMFYPTAQDVYVRPDHFLPMVAHALVQGGYRGGFGNRVGPDNVSPPAPGRASVLLRMPRSTWGASSPDALGLNAGG